MRKLLLILVLAAGATGLAACGSDNNADDASSAMRLAGDDTNGGDGGNGGNGGNATDDASGNGGNGGNGGDGGVGVDASSTTTTTAESPLQWAESFCNAVAPKITDLINLFEAIGDGANVGAQQELNTIVALLSTMSNEITTLGPPPITNGQALYDEYPPALNKAIATLEQNSDDPFEFLDDLSSDLNVSSAAQSGWNALESEMANASGCASVQSLL